VLTDNVLSHLRSDIFPVQSASAPTLAGTALVPAGRQGCWWSCSTRAAWQPGQNKKHILDVNSLDGTDGAAVEQHCMSSNTAHRCAGQLWDRHASQQQTSVEPLLWQLTRWSTRWSWGPPATKENVANSWQHANPANHLGTNTIPPPGEPRCSLLVW